MQRLVCKLAARGNTLISRPGGGMVDVTSKKCDREGCQNSAKFGVAGSHKREFCGQHVMECMVNMYSKKCGREGYQKHAMFGVGGVRKR